MTVFNGQGGMEFPMMCNNSAVKELQGTVHLTSHEICHTYFPFYMGINERKYAWMDEGWATMLPFDFQTENAPGYDPRSRNAEGYSEVAGYDSDLPMMIPSYDLRGPAYRTASYRRPGAAYEFLRQVLGDEVFKKALREYMNRWNGKHPIPYDFFFTFDNVVGEDLSWFWKPWFFEQGFPDLGIKAVSNGKEVIVERIGSLPVPLDLEITYDDGSNEIIHKTAKVWEHGEKEISIKINEIKKIMKAELLTIHNPDVNKENNIFEEK
jgi:aminopeptidase N